MAEMHAYDITDSRTNHIQSDAVDGMDAVSDANRDANIYSDNHLFAGVVCKCNP